MPASGTTCHSSGTTCHERGITCRVKRHHVPTNRSSERDLNREGEQAVIGPWWGKTFKGKPWKDVPDWWINEQLSFDDQPVDKRKALEAEAALRKRDDSDARGLHTKCYLAYKQLRGDDDVPFDGWLTRVVGPLRPDERMADYYERCWPVVEKLMAEQHAEGQRFRDWLVQRPDDLRQLRPGESIQDFIARKNAAYAQYQQQADRSTAA